MNLEQAVQQYEPFNEQEEKDRAFILRALLEEKNVFDRTNKAMHMTASAWVVNQKYDKVLMCYHNIYQSYSWLGGHADGNRNLLEVSMREVKEESGLTKVKALSDQIFSLEVLTVDGHRKNGAYVSSHLHLNVTYLLQASSLEPLKVKPDENKDVAWFTLQGALQASTEPWFVEHVYKKLNRKLLLYLQHEGIC